MTTTNSLAAALAVGAGVLAALPCSAAVDPFDGNWRFSVTPYVWMPNVNANLDYDLPPRAAELLGDGARALSAEVGPNDYLDDLQFAVMLSGDVRKGRWSVYTDFIYLDLGSQDSHVRSVRGLRGEALATVSRQAEIDISSTVWTLGGGYTVAHDNWGNLDLLAGFRYLSMDTDLKWQIDGSGDRLAVASSVSNDQEEWDGIVGARGRILFGDTNWFMPYYLDVGTGSSNWTWQAILGVGYRFGWGETTLAIRSLSYDFDEHDADIRFTGPAIGVTFRW